MVRIYSDLLTEDELSFVQREISGNHWGYGYISTDASKPIWNFDKQRGKPVAELIASKLDYRLTDWHINGQTMGQSGSPHKDEYDQCDTAFVFFFQDWNYEWGGRLHIFDTNTTIITPQKNTGVLFDASLFHYAEAPVINTLRMSIGLKLQSTLSPTRVKNESI